jgi:hypothetical protein
MSIQNDITAYKSVVNNNVSTQSEPNSIAPETVGAIGIDLADIILPELLKINNLNVTGGTAMPDGGQMYDVYFKSNLNEIQIWRNINGTWTLKGSIPLGISYPDGIILGLRTSIDGSTATVSPGTWAIQNTAYNKNTQTQLTIDPRDLNYGRWDLIYANTANQISLYKGVASNVPSKPLLPVNSIAVDYIYVPSTGSPFLLSGSTAGGSTSIGKTKITVQDGNKVINWQSDIIPGDVVTYAQKHSNTIAVLQGHYDAGGGSFTPYLPNYTYTQNNDGTINQVTITELFAGTITII